MLELVDFDLFKCHVRADEFADDDVVLRHYLGAATAAIVGATNRTEEELVEMGSGSLPLPLQQAVLLLGGLWYDHRESAVAVQMHDIPGGIIDLVRPFTKLSNRE